MKISNSVVSSLALVAGFGVVSAVQAEELHTFKRIQLSDQFWGEGANFGDLNKDGVNDLVSGPWWWEGPELKWDKLSRRRWRDQSSTRSWLMSRPVVARRGGSRLRHLGRGTEGGSPSGP